MLLIDSLLFQGSFNGFSSIEGGDVTVLRSIRCVDCATKVSIKMGGFWSSSPYYTLGRSTSTKMYSSFLVLGCLAALVSASPYGGNNADLKKRGDYSKPHSTPTVGSK